MLFWGRSGCAWRFLPNDLPPWQTVHHDWRIWRLEGRWERIMTVLRERTRQRRDPTPGAAIIDSQRVRITDRGVGTATTAPRRQAAANAT
jgi:putative transposase